MKYILLGSALLLGTQSAMAGSVGDIFLKENIGKSVERVSKDSGAKAISEGNGEYTFEANNCIVRAITNSGTITRLDMTLSNTCQPNWQKLAFSEKPLPAQTTFSQFAKLFDTDRYYSDCLSSCGNASDPNIYLYQPGSSAESFVDIIAIASTDDDSTSATAYEWQKSMASFGDDYITEAKFNCDTSKHAAAASKAFANVAIQTLRLTTHFSDDFCK